VQVRTTQDPQRAQEPKATPGPWAKVRLFVDRSFRPEIQGCRHWPLRPLDLYLKAMILSFRAEAVHLAIRQGEAAQANSATRDSLQTTAGKLTTTSSVASGAHSLGCYKDVAY